MKIALRCEKCRLIWMQGEEDLCLEVDFYEKKMSFVCPHCKKDNIIEWISWQKEQKNKSLPKINFVST